MSCCGDPRPLGFETEDPAFADPALPSAFAAALARQDGRFRLDLWVPDIHCAACIGRIENALARLDPGLAARVNFTRRTVALEWTGAGFAPSRALAVLRDLGYAPQPVAAGERPAGAGDPHGAELLRAVAVAGFAAMNVMLLSVSVWSGADGTTRTFLNWFAALIALPAITYAARPFFRSAIAAVRAFSLNMDVPISLAIVLAAGLSLAETAWGSGEAYFDAAITLTFFLLVGRTLDHFTRERARSSVSRLAAMSPQTAEIVEADGELTRVPVAAITAGTPIRIAAGERVPVDATLDEESAAFDAALATGESRTLIRLRGEEVLAGVLALSGPHRLTAARPAADSFLARLTELQSAAETARSRPARIADRAARIYAPVVHLVALATFAGWLAAGIGVGPALTIAIAVLIITCPCALGLAVPAVQVAACDRLFRAGLAIKDGGALERLREIDSVVFDKTGTLTIPALDPAARIDDADLAAAAALARHSTHPVSRAMLRAATGRGLALPPVGDVAEHPGFGISGRIAGRRAFLGRGAARWEPRGDAVRRAASGTGFTHAASPCHAADLSAAAGGGGGAGGPDGPGGDDAAPPPAENLAVPPVTAAQPERLALRREGAAAVALPIVEAIRPGAQELVAAFRASSLPMTILSGDEPEPVARTAAALGIEDWHALCPPDAKLAALTTAVAGGARPLMVGDGLNDGPALAAAHVSAAPADASDLSRAGADIVVLTDRLDGLATAWRTAREAHRIILQNFAIAAAYNAVAIPAAVAGYASPLVAALAMSTSSILVTLNAMRLLRRSPASAARRSTVLGPITARGIAGQARRRRHPLAGTRRRSADRAQA